MHLRSSGKYLSKEKKEWKGFLYILPVIVVLAFLDFYPIAYSVYISLTNFSEFHFFNFQVVGLKNYELILRTSLFGQILFQNLEFAGGSILLMAPVGFLLALVMTQPGMRGGRIYRTFILFPWAFPAFITILVWSGMLDYRFGIINRILATFGYSNIYWLGTASTAMLSIILVNIWLSFPYYTFVFTAALQSVPKELIEAAEIDGYGPVSRLFRITVPLLSRQIAFIMVFGFIFTWSNFYIPYLLTGGGPGTSTQILITYSYDSAFSYLQFSIGAAYAIISVVILFVLVAVVNKYSKMMTVLY